jgi:hypothetical protein
MQPEPGRCVRDGHPVHDRMRGIEHAPLARRAIQIFELVVKHILTVEIDVGIGGRLLLHVVRAGANFVVYPTSTFSTPSYSPERVGDWSDVVLLGIIRLWHLLEQVSIREIAMRLGISRDSVRRYLRSDD